jgi:Family of unknown function (DUF6182)
MFSQERLFAELSRRIQIVRDRHGASREPASPPAAPIDLSILDAAVMAAPDIAAIAVIRDFDPVAFARASLAFAFLLPEDWRSLWFSAYTRTIFLAGNPANLKGRFPFQYVADDGSSAWLGPASPQLAMSLRRLLVLFRGDPAPRLTNKFTLTAPLAASGEPTAQRPERSVYIGAAGLSASDYLVHLNHTLAESVLTGLIVPGDTVTIRHLPRLHGCREELAWLRVHRDNKDANRLRAYAGVSTCD